MTAAVKKIIEEVKTLNAAERLELEAALREASLPSRPATEADLVALLEREGVIAKRARPLQPLTEFQPVPITGKSVSEILIEDRR